MSPSGVASPPSMEANSMPGIGLVRKSMKGFTGSSVPAIFCVIGSSRSFTSDPMSMRSRSSDTCGALAFWPSAQSQLMTRSAAIFGTPGMPGASSTRPSRRSALTVKEAANAILKMGMRSRLLPLKSMPSVASTPPGWKPAALGSLSMSVTRARKNSSLPSAAKGVSRFGSFGAPSR